MSLCCCLECFGNGNLAREVREDFVFMGWVFGYLGIIVVLIMVMIMIMMGWRRIESNGLEGDEDDSWDDNFCVSLTQGK